MNANKRTTPGARVCTTARMMVFLIVVWDLVSTRARVCILLCFVVTMAEVLRVMRSITDGQGRPRLRVLVLTSPPWGIFADDHDKPLTDQQILVSGWVLLL